MFNYTNHKCNVLIGRNVPYMVLRKLCVYLLLIYEESSCQLQQYKVLRFDPIGKIFQSYSSLTPLNCLKINFVWMPLDKVCFLGVFCFVCWSKIQDGCHCRTWWGNVGNILETWNNRMIPYKFSFLMLIGNPSSLLLQDKFNIGPNGKFLF